MKITRIWAVLLLLLLFTMPLCHADNTGNAQMWREIAENVELTGDWREDMLSVARSQLGYSEYLDNYEIYDDGVKHYYTLYGDEFGEPYEEWCTYFVGFCIKYAGIDNVDFPFYNGAKYWINVLKYMGAYVEADAKTEPKPGDLILFCWSEEGKMEHIGIVESVNEDIVNTIEGNKGSDVRRHSYKLKDDDILAYISLDVLMEKVGIIPPETEEIQPVSGKVNADKVNVREEPSTASKRLAVLPLETKVTVTGKCVKQNGDLWYRIEVNDIKGFIRSDYIVLE